MFAKGLTPNWSKDVFTIKSFRNTLLCTYVINDLNGEKAQNSIAEDNNNRMIFFSLPY